MLRLVSPNCCIQNLGGMHIRLSPLVALLTALSIAVTSCSKPIPRYTGPGALESGHWTKVKKQPPTYYPKGLSANAPTDRGLWVSSRDPDGPRFFIPADEMGRVTNEQLTHEAHASTGRLPTQSELRDEQIKGGLSMIVKVPLALAALALVLWLWSKSEDDDFWD